MKTQSMKKYNVVPCDVPEDVLTSPPALLGQHRIDEFPANLQLHMQKYLKKCLEFNALQDKVAALEKELEEHWASESVGREDIAPWEYSRIMDNSNQCWSGKNSDKQLVLLTDFTKKLQYGDEVMADRGFNVTEELAVLGVRLIKPAFTKGKNQLLQVEVQSRERFLVSASELNRVSGNY
ncbi:hypothetical protein HPB51_005073 [Rhipicephalus microplus]|uniref:DDE Tnp4 domain-containing protein n=1 Tax=Rhipicephalus microplus TaxID=6941 RepID=A0A9J6DL22_RHIMP|nr:hypothetical protein HPB51_005073 [Rhipicephalus microplus]